MKESRTLEFKEKITNTFLKTVSAYANYGTGTIKFGINDEGELVGISNPKDLCLDIENRINDSITPVPEYTLELENNASVIVLTVQEGKHKPYLYKSKAYKRNDSATIEISRVELTRLILEGENRNFEELKASNQNLTYSKLEKELKNIMNIKELNKDILKTLELYNDDIGYNNAASLLADRNKFPGIDTVKFGNSINIMKDRLTSECISVLMQYDEAIELYRKYYQYEEIKGKLREKKELVPEEAFREAVANALVHRSWDISSHIRISMFEDCIEIISPGGLTSGISEEEYLEGQVSVLRNPILGNVFFRLNLIERFGTGVRRINESYKKSDAKPIFEVTDNSIKVILPIFSSAIDLTENEKIIYFALKEGEKSSSELMKASGFGKSKVIKLLKSLLDEGYIKVVGSGRGTKYRHA